MLGNFIPVCDFSYPPTGDSPAPGLDDDLLNGLCFAESQPCYFNRDTLTVWGIFCLGSILLQPGRGKAHCSLVPVEIYN